MPYLTETEYKKLQAELDKLDRENTELKMKLRKVYNNTNPMSDIYPDIRFCKKCNEPIT